MSRARPRERVACANLKRKGKGYFSNMNPVKHRVILGWATLQEGNDIRMATSWRRSFIERQLEVPRDGMCSSPIPCGVYAFAECRQRMSLKNAEGDKLKEKRPRDGCLGDDKTVTAVSRARIVLLVVLWRDCGVHCSMRTIWLRWIFHIYCAATYTACAMWILQKCHLGLFFAGIEVRSFLQPWKLRDKVCIAHRYFGIKRWVPLWFALVNSFGSPWGFPESFGRITLLKLSLSHPWPDICFLLGSTLISTRLINGDCFNHVLYVLTLIRQYI